MDRESEFKTRQEETQGHLYKVKKMDHLLFYIDQQTVRKKKIDQQTNLCVAKNAQLITWSTDRLISF
jgi:hypothetical protein